LLVLKMLRQPWPELGIMIHIDTENAGDDPKSAAAPPGTSIQPVCDVTDPKKAPEKEAGKGPAAQVGGCEPWKTPVRLVGERLFATEEPAPSVKYHAASMVVPGGAKAAGAVS